MSHPYKNLLRVLLLLGFMHGTPAYCGLQDDVSVTLASAHPRYDAAQRRFVVTGHLTNVSAAPIQAPISLVLEGFDLADQSLGLQNPDGTLTNGKQYRVLLPQGQLEPGEQAGFEFYLVFANPFSTGAVTALEKLAQKAFKFKTPPNAQVGFTYDLLRMPAGNHQPTADAGVDRIGTVAGAVVLDGSYSADADGDPISFEWKLTAWPSGSSAQLVDSETATPSLTADVPGTYQVSLTVSDGYVSSLADTVSITINAVAGANQSPKITSTANTTATATRGYSYQLRAGDPDGDALIYRLKTAPSGMSISDKGFIEWLVPNIPHQHISVEIEVDDGRGGIAEEKFSIHIQPCTC